MKKSKAIGVLTTLLTLLVLPLVAGDFSISGETAVSTCGGSTAVITDTVSTDKAAAFNVVSQGSADSFATTVPSGFGLAADKEQIIYSYVTPTSKIMPGTYDLTIKVESEGKVRELTHQITVKDCFVVTAEVDDQVACPCELTTFDLLISNEGAYRENYDISIEGLAEEWTTFSDTSVNIDAEESVVVNAYVQPPCSVYGTYELTFKVKSTTSFAKMATAKAQLEIKPCYEYTVSTAKDYYKICDHESLEVPLTITSEGTAENIYKINLYGPGWAALELKELSISAGADAETKIIAGPDFGVEGNFTLEVEVLTEYGDVKKSTDTRIDVERCYDVLVDIQKEQDKTCNAISNTYAAIIKNTGKFDNTYTIAVSGVEWASLDKERISIEAGEEGSVTLDVSPPYDTAAGNYTIYVEAKDPISGATNKDSIAILTSTRDECYKPAISTEQETSDIAQDTTATILLVLENKGTQEAAYVLDLSGTGTSFSQLNPSTVQLEPGKAEILYLYVAPHLKTKVGRYEATISARLEDGTILGSKTVTINVMKVKVKEVEEVIEEAIEEELEEVEEQKVTIISKIGSKIKSLLASIGTFFKNIFTKEKIEEEAEEEEEENVTVEENVTNVTEENVTVNVTEENITNVTEENVTVNVTENVTENATLNETCVVNATLNETCLGLNETATNETAVNETEENVTANVTEELGNVTEEAEENVSAEAEAEEEIELALEKENFFAKYKSYITGALIVILIILIFVTGLWRKIISFFEEEEVVRNNRKK